LWQIEALPILAYWEMSIEDGANYSNGKKSCSSLLQFEMFYNFCQKYFRSTRIEANSLRGKPSCIYWRNKKRKLAYPLGKHKLRKMNEHITETLGAFLIRIRAKRCGSGSAISVSGVKAIRSRNSEWENLGPSINCVPDP
jgi:hypothetical protein